MFFDTHFSRFQYKVHKLSQLTVRAFVHRHNWHHAYPWDYAASQDGIFLQWNPTKLLLDGLWLIGQTHSFKRKSISKPHLSGAGSIGVAKAE